MDRRENDHQSISRRVAFTAMVFALGGATAALLSRPVVAQQKISQSLAQYQTAPKDNDHCAACNNFQPPNSCKFVEGQISPNGWCPLFTAKT